MTHRSFQPIHRAFVKQILILFVIILISVPVINAEEICWYKIDGIKIRYGTFQHTTFFDLPGEGQIIRTNNNFSHLKDTRLFPIAITLPETLMNSWSFRGALFEWQSPNEMKDLVPVDSSEISSTTKQRRQKDEVRTLLYNDFFNADDQAFADANSNWALSTDVISSRVFLGYYWGVFYPAFEYHRFVKTGLGVGAYYSEISYKLNLCSQYKVTPNSEDSRFYDGECVGKKEIDSAEAKVFGHAVILYISLWERFTKDSIWKFGSLEGAYNTNRIKDILKLKNHNQNLGVSISSSALELISYTYRF